MSDNPNVIFIAGSGRSGTTLLDCLLGQYQGFFSAGELAQIWKRGALQDQLCGCGEPFRSCSFWNAVLVESFGSSSHDFETLERLRKAAQRARYIPYYLSHRDPPEREVSVYRDALAALYRGIKKISACDFVVDSSKEPPHGFLVSSLPGFEFRVIHLIRNSMAVAYSWKRKRLRPEIHWREQYMPVRKVFKSAYMWNYYHVGTELLRTVTKSSVALRYEDLTGDPASSMKRILSWLGQGHLQSEAIFEFGKIVNFRQNHSIGGNPFRFKTGAIQIKTDDEWKRRMTRRDKAGVIAVTFPLLAKYYWLDHRQVA